MADRAGQLVAVEGFALAVLLGNGEVAQLDALEGREAGTASLTLTPPPDRRPVFRGTAVLHLAVFVRAEGAAHSLALVDRETPAELTNPLVDRALDVAVPFEAVALKAVEHVRDHVRDVPELGLAE